MGKKKSIGMAATFINLARRGTSFFNEKLNLQHGDDPFAKAPEGQLFPKVDPAVDGEDCDHDCASCTIRYPAKFSIDEKEELYGHVKGWATHLLVATGKTDWVRDVEDEKGSVMEAVGRAEKPRNGVGGDFFRSAGLKSVCFFNFPTRFLISRLLISRKLFLRHAGHLLVPEAEEVLTPETIVSITSFGKSRNPPFPDTPPPPSSTHSSQPHATALHSPRHPLKPHR